MIGWRGFSRLLGFISTLVLAQLLVPADFGLVAIATSLLAVIESFSELGLKDALVRHPESSRALEDSAFTLQAIRAILAGGVIGASAWISADWFGDPRLVHLTLILGGVAAISGLENIAVVRFQRNLQFGVQFRLLLVPRLVQFLLTIGAAYLWRDYWALVLGIVVGRAGRVVLTYFVAPYRPRLSLARWRDLVGFSFWSWVSSMVTMVQVRADTFILGPVLGAMRLGVYFVGAELAGLPATEFVYPASTALFAGVSAARNRGEETGHVVVPLIVMLTIVILPVSIGLSATAGYIVAGVLGPKWSEARAVIAILALTNLVAPINYVSVSVLNAAGNIHRGVYAKLGAASVRVGALVIGNALGQLTWIAVALGIAVLMEAALYLWQLSRTRSLRWAGSISALARSAVATGVTAAALWLTGLGWQEETVPGILHLLRGVAIGSGTVVSAIGLHWFVWRVVGRPSGPERRLLDLIAKLAPVIRFRNPTGPS